MWRDLASCQGRFVTTVPWRHVPSTGQNLASGLQLPGPVSRDYIADSSICLRVFFLPSLPTSIQWATFRSLLWATPVLHVRLQERYMLKKKIGCGIRSHCFKRILPGFWRYKSLSYWGAFDWSRKNLASAEMFVITFYYSHVGRVA